MNLSRLNDGRDKIRDRSVIRGYFTNDPTIYLLATGTGSAPAIASASLNEPIEYSASAARPFVRRGEKNVPRKPAEERRTGKRGEERKKEKKEEKEGKEEKRNALRGVGWVEGREGRVG